MIHLDLLVSFLASHWSESHNTGLWLAERRWELATACIREEHYYNIHPMPTFCWSVSLSKLDYRKIFNTLFDPILWQYRQKYFINYLSSFQELQDFNDLDCIIRLWGMAYGFEIILIKFTHGIIRSLELSLILVRQSRFVMNEYTFLLIAVFSKILCHCTQGPQSTAACK